MDIGNSRVSSVVNSPLRSLLLIGAVVLLILSWGALFWLISLETNLLLPYDTSWYDYWGWPQGSPPPGSWQRELNYFLESPVGSVLPAILVVGTNVLLLGITFFRLPQFREKPLPLLLNFAIFNLVSVPVMFLASYAVIASFAGRLEGWSGTAIAWLPTCFLLILLFAVQVRVLPQRLRRRWNRQ